MNNNINNVHGYINSKPYNYSAPVNFNVGTGVLGSYDNIRFETNTKEGWKHPPANPPIKSNYMFLPQGTPLPLKNEMIYSELPADRMLMFARSYASPNCCPSTFSTDRGCVCTTEFERKLVGEQRGLNKSYNNYNF